jgi:GntR family transcriptional regulator, transcriptional repressor for pyruvate dehydrogenase complex
MKFSSEPNLKRAPKLSEQIAEFLISEIKKGSFAPGEYLPSEAILSKQFSVSRTVIREALSKLKHDGMLESSQGSKTRVTESGVKKVFRMEELEPFNLEELGYLYELRTILESEASSLAAKRRNKNDLNELKALIDKLDIAVKLGLDGTVDNVKFHKAVAKASQNPYISEFMSFLSSKIYDLVNADRKHSKHTGLPHDVQGEHINIFQAIKEKNAAKARDATILHLTNAAKRRGLTIY